MPPIVSLRQRHQGVSVFVALALVASGLVSMPFVSQANGGPEVIGDLSSVCAATSEQSFSMGTWDHSSGNSPSENANAAFANPADYTLAGALTSEISNGVARISGIPASKTSSDYISLPVSTTADRRVVLSDLTLTTLASEPDVKVSTELFLLEVPIQSQIVTGFAEGSIVSGQTQRFETTTTLLRTEGQYFVRVFFWGHTSVEQTLELDSISLNFKKCLAAAPTSVSYTPSNTSIRVDFTPPTITGESSITNYEYSLDAGANWVSPSTAVTSSPLLIENLTGGTTYQVQTRAVTQSGPGLPSAVTDVRTTGEAAIEQSTATVARQLGAFFVGQTYAPRILDLPDTTFTLKSGSNLPSGVTFDGTAKSLTVAPTSSNVGKFSFTVERLTDNEQITYEGYIAHFVLDNGKLRFGAMIGSVVSPSTSAVENAVNDFGNLTLPHYFSQVTGEYIQLTYSWPNIPLNMALGFDTPQKTSGMWNDNQVFEIITSRSDVQKTSNQIDLSGFNYSIGSSSFVSRLNSSVIAGIIGTGTIKSTAEFKLNPGPDEFSIRIVNTYTLDPGKSFVRINTSITNLSAVGKALENLNFWVGTRDDWVGQTDSPIKTKGNLLANGFTPITDQDQLADSIKIESGDEAILFHSPAPGTNTISDSCCSFSNSYKKNPVDSEIRTSPRDGSYAAFVPLTPSLAPTASRTFTWFYAAGAVEDLATVVEQVAEISAEVAATQETAEPPAPTPPTTGGEFFQVVAPVVPPQITPTPSRPRPSPTPSPTLAPAPVPVPVVTQTPEPLGPVVLIPTLDPTPNVRYDNSNPVPRILVEILSRPLGYILEQLSGSPVLPKLAPAESLAYENGSPVVIQLVKTDDENGYVLIGDGWQVALEANDTAGEPLRLDDSGNIILNQDRFVQFSGSGFAPGSIIRVWLFSDPSELGDVTADASGNFVGQAQLPEGIPTGEHTIQLNGLTKDGQLRSVSLGVVVQPDLVVAPAAPVGFDLSGLLNFLWLIATGVLIWFFIVWRRRKKKEEEGQIASNSGLEGLPIFASEGFEPTQQLPNDSRRKVGPASPPNRKRFTFKPKGA